jgi:prophage regulatory protein
MVQDDRRKFRLQRFYTIHDVILITTLSRATIYRKMASGTFPARVSISERRVAWDAHDVETWCESRKPR